MILWLRGPGGRGRTTVRSIALGSVGATARSTARAAVLAVLAVGLAGGSALGPGAGPATAVEAPAPDVTATDLLVVWDGSRERFAVRWHVRTPVTRVAWLVATPAPAQEVRLGADTLRAVTDVAMPRDRWYVTHPWLLFNDDGGRARNHLLLPATPGAGSAPAVRSTVLAGRTAALDAVAAAGGAVDDVTRAWLDAALDRGWSLHLVTVTTAAPTTVLGPVALEFASSTPVVPSSAWPRTDRVTLLTVAPRVLAAEQPALAAPDADGSDADGSDAADPAAGDAPSFTVENARELRTPFADLSGWTSPTGRWAVTALSGRTPGVAPAVLLPQDGRIRDWRTQVGVWWPGWGAAASAVLVALVVLALAVVGTRRRRRRDVVVVVLDAREAEAAEADDDLVATRPDIRRVT